VEKNTAAVWRRKQKEWMENGLSMENWSLKFWGSKIFS
jgi:hypothetical protein